MQGWIESQTEVLKFWLLAFEISHCQSSLLYILYLHSWWETPLVHVYKTNTCNTWLSTFTHQQCFFDVQKLGLSNHSEVIQRKLDMFYGRQEGIHMYSQGIKPMILAVLALYSVLWATWMEMWKNLPNLFVTLYSTSSFAYPSKEAWSIGWFLLALVVLQLYKEVVIEGWGRAHYIVLYCKPARNGLFDYKGQRVGPKTLPLGKKFKSQSMMTSLMQLNF